MSHLFDVTGRNPVTGRVVKLTLQCDTQTAARDKGMSCGLAEVSVTPHREDRMPQREGEGREPPNGHSG